MSLVVIEGRSSNIVSEFFSGLGGKRSLRSKTLLHYSLSKVESLTHRSIFIDSGDICSRRRSRLIISLLGQDKARNLDFYISVPRLMDLDRRVRYRIDTIVRYENGILKVLKPTRFISEDEYGGEVFGWEVTEATKVNLDKLVKR